MPRNDSCREQIAAEVRAELARQNWTQLDAAQIIGLPKQAVQVRLAGKRSFRAEELARLAAALKVPVTRFMPTTVVPLPADPEIRSIPRDDDYGREIAA